MQKSNSYAINHRKSVSATKKFCCSSLILLVAAMVWGTDTTLVSSSARVTVPKINNSNGQSLAFYAPNTKMFYFTGAANTTSITTKLIIETRMPYSYWAGVGDNALRLMVNGAVVQAYVGIRDGGSGSLCRLTNKPVVSWVASGTTGPWFTERDVWANYESTWSVVYAPNDYPSYPSFFTASPYTTSNPYRFELDITDLIRPSVQNEVRVTNFIADYDMEIISLTISTSSGTSPLVTTETATVRNLQYPRHFTANFTDDHVSPYYTTNALDFYTEVSPSGGALLKIYNDPRFPITAGSHYWFQINNETAQDVVAATGGILKMTVHYGSNLHVRVWPQ